MGRDMSKLERLAELENQRWARAATARPPFVHGGGGTGSATGGIGAAAEGQVEWRAYSPLGDEESTSAGTTRMWQFGFIDATAVGGVLLVRFAWRPEETGHEYLLVVPFDHPESVDLDGGSVEIFEHIMFRVVDRPGWREEAIRLTPTTSVLMPRT